MAEAKRKRRRKCDLIPGQFDLMHHPDFEDAKNREEFLRPLEGFDELLQLARSRDLGHNAYSGIPLLSREQERHLFRQMNCAKYAANLLRECEQKRTLQRQVKEISDVLCVFNMRLGLGQLKRKGLTGEHFETQLSHVHESILRAIARFDYSLGNKFSTYCTWAIRQNLCRTIYQATQVKYVDEYPKEPYYHDDHDGVENSTLVDELMLQLGRRERMVINCSVLTSQKETLEAIGKKLGVSKERVRQIKMSALYRLRTAALKLCPDLVESI